MVRKKYDFTKLANKVLKISILNPTNAKELSYILDGKISLIKKNSYDFSLLFTLKNFKENKY